MSKFRTDNVEIRRGAYDPITKEGLPQPDQLKEKVSPHKKEQQGADVRGVFVPGSEPVLPRSSPQRKEPLTLPLAGPARGRLAQVVRSRRVHFKPLARRHRHTRRSPPEA